MTSSDDETLRYIASAFPSVWALELLFILKRAGGRCSREDLVEKMRSSEIVVSKALDALEAAGTISIEGDSAIYRPVNSGVESAVDRAEILYRRKPNAVFRAIVSARTDGATAFANAFKIRRGKDD